MGDGGVQPDQGLPIRISEQIEIAFGGRRADPGIPSAEPMDRDHVEETDDDDRDDR